MYWRLLLCVVIVFGFAQGVSAQVFVDDDFNYADQAAFEAAWNPDFGNGNFDLTGLITAGRLVPDPNNPNIISPNDDPISWKSIPMAPAFLLQRPSIRVFPLALTQSPSA